MEIFLFDDNERGTKDPLSEDFINRYGDILKRYVHLEENSDLSFLNGASCVLIHASFVDTAIGTHTFTDSRDNFERILETVEGKNIPFVIFSGGFRDFLFYPEESDYPENGKINKKIFYERLEKFLTIFKQEEKLDIEGLIKNFPNQVNPTEDNNILDSESRFENFVSINESNKPIISDPDSIESFFLSLEGKRGVVFDLDNIDNITITRDWAILLRLSIKELREKAFLPIIFLGSKDWFEFVKLFSSENAADILLCKGSYIVKKDTKLIFPDNNIEPLTPEDYKNYFINNIKIIPSADSGNHTIANEYGAYIMSQFIPKNRFSQEDYARIGKIETIDIIYLKYLLVSRLSIQEIESIVNNNDKGEITCLNEADLPQTRGKRILFVDDQDKEWEYVMRAFLKAPATDNGNNRCQLTVVGKGTGLITHDNGDKYLTPEAIRIIDDSEEFDLIILDLRIGGIHEENISNPDNLSGMKLLQKIIEKNEGQQVILFTSSNKAWNMQKALLEYNAASYYIKESPDQLKKENESKGNLLKLANSINSCLEKGYLKKIVRDIKKFAEEIDNTIKEDYNDNYSYSDRFEIRNELYSEIFDDLDEYTEQLELIKNQLIIAKNLHLQAARKLYPDPKQYTFAFIALEQVLEIIRKWDPEVRNANNYREEPRVMSSLSWILQVADKIGMDEIRDLINQLNAFISARNDFIHFNDPRNNFHTVDPAEPKSFMNLWECIFQFLKAIREE